MVHRLTRYGHWSPDRLAYSNYRGRPNRLDYEYVSGAHLLNQDTAHLPQDLKVRYLDRQVHNPYLLIVRLINTGPRPIKETDFRKSIKITLDVQ